MPFPTTFIWALSSTSSRLFPKEILFLIKCKGSYENSLFSFPTPTSISTMTSPSSFFSFFFRSFFLLLLVSFRCRSAQTNSILDG